MKGWTHSKDCHDRNGKAIRHSLSAKGIKNKPVDLNLHKNVVPIPNVATLDNIYGGLADNKLDEGFNKDNLKEGMTVESEHTDNVELAKEIAKDHLTENPKYYQELKKVEEGLSKRERRFINNFIMSSKDYNDYTNNMNWKQDVRLYGLVKNLSGKYQFYKDLINKYGYLKED